NNRFKHRDNFRGWISFKNNKKEEVALYESYSFFYIMQTLYQLKTSGWLETSIEKHRWFVATLNFIEINIWKKWYARSVKVKGNHYWYFLRGRTHMGSHWAGIAMYLNLLTNDLKIKNQTRQMVAQYDILLKRNLQ